MMPHWRRRLARLALALASTLATLLVAEAGLRLAGWWADIDFRLYAKELTNPERLPAGLLTGSPVLGVRLQPGAEVLATTSDFSVRYRVNGRGLRDRDREARPPPGAVRVLALGDSLTFGEGVPAGRRFTDVAEDAFDNLEMINAGVPGYGLDQELAYLATEGVGWAPHQVFLFLTWVQTRRYSLDLLDGGRVVIPAASAPRQLGPQYLDRQAPRRALLGSSYLLSYLGYHLQRARLRERFTRADERLWAGIHREARRTLERANVPREQLLAMLRRRTELLLAELQRLAEAHGFGVVVVEIDTGDRPPCFTRLPPGVTHHSLRPLLDEEAARRDLGFTYDPHYDPETHALLGEAVADILRRGTPGLSASGRVLVAAPAAREPPAGRGGGAARQENQLGPRPAAAGAPEPAATTTPSTAGSTTTASTTTTAAPTATPSTATPGVETPSGADAPAATGTPGLAPAAAAAFVDCAHARLLGRAPRPDELRRWRRRVERDGRARAELLAELLTSDEHLRAWRHELLLLWLYEGVFGRLPDAVGFAAHRDQLASGHVPAADLVAQWVASDEWAAKLGRLDNAQLVSRLGRALLGREPTDSEVTRWVDGLADGGLPRLLQRLLASPEHREHTRTALLPCRLLLAGAGRLPTPEEHAFWQGRLELGEPPLRVIEALIESAWAGAKPAPAAR